jgi:predicted nuclease of predicted toxin-antitoxin system
MNFHALKFLADENIHPAVIDFLKSLSFNVISISERSLNGKSDNEILKSATDEGRVVITQGADFGKLIFTTDTDFIGIIYLRPGHISADFHIKTLQAVMSETLDLRPPFLLVVENEGKKVKIRLRNSLR